MEDTMECQQETIVIQGNRVALGLIGMHHLPQITRIVNDVRVARFIMASPPLYPENEKEWLERLAKRNDTDKVFAVFLKNKTEDGAPYTYIGHMGLHLRNQQLDVGTTGAVLAPEYLGKGYGTEAKMLLLYLGFRFFGVRKVCSLVLASNTRSRRYLENTGYRQIGVYEKHIFRDGVLQDEYIYELFAEEWTPIWDEYREKHGISDPMPTLS